MVDERALGFGPPPGPPEGCLKADTTYTRTALKADTTYKRKVLYTGPQRLGVTERAKTFCVSVTLWPLETTVDT
jgi:hypothetical protein